MKLRDWFKARPEIVIADVAKELGFEYGYLHRIVRGKAMPGRSLCAAIHHLTNGEVSVDDLFDFDKLKQLACAGVDKKRQKMLKVCEKVRQK